MSHLIRNILEDTFQLVDNVVDGVDEIVSDSVELARRVGRDARRMAGAVRDAVADADGAEPAAAPASEAAESVEPLGAEQMPTTSVLADPLAHVFAWNGVIANHATRCERCDASIERGSEAYLGLSDDAAQPRTWLCPSCREGL